MKQYDNAAKWFQEAIAQDPKRAIAYLNLGDVYADQQKPVEARAAYEKFLALSPSSTSAAAVREKLQTLQ